MKKQYKIILPIIIVAGMLFGFQITNKPDPEKDKVLIGLVRYALKQGHYEPHLINDDFSEKVFTDFIDALDPYKRFFIQSDIEEFSKFKTLIDDQIKSEDLTFYNVVMQRFNQRVLESQNFYREILQKPFDFNKEDNFDVDYDKKKYSLNQAELIKNWQKQLKVSTLSRLHEKIQLQESMNNTDESSNEAAEVPVEKEVSLKSFEELEIESREAAEKIGRAHV